MGWDEGTTEERDVLTMPAKAGAAVAIYRILKKGVAANEVLVTTAGTDMPQGVSGNASEDNKATYATGDYIALKYMGIVYIKMSGVGLRNDRVMPTANGLGLRHVNTDGVYVIGFAMEAWTDGQIIPVMIDRFFVGDYTLS